MKNKKKYGACEAKIADEFPGAKATGNITLIGDMGYKFVDVRGANMAQWGVQNTDYGYLMVNRHGVIMSGPTRAVTLAALRCRLIELKELKLGDMTSEEDLNNMGYKAVKLL